MRGADDPFIMKIEKQDNPEEFIPEVKIVQSTAELCQKLKVEGEYEEKYMKVKNENLNLFTAFRGADYDGSNL